MTPGERILEELRHQRAVEGDTRDTRLLLKAIRLVKTTSEWQMLVRVVHVSYGKYSYQTKRFYYPTPLLNSIVEIEEDDL